MSNKSELVGNYFGTIYLTVMSLLQGIVLAQLVPSIIRYTELATDPWRDVHLLPLVLMLLIIFNIWHHYAIGIFFLRWFPNIIDTIIPFMISLAQFFLVSYLDVNDSVNDIDVTAWMKGFAVILLLGCFAYFGAVWRLDADLFTNIMSKENAVIHVIISRKFYKLAGFAVLFQGLFALLIVFLQKETWLLFSLIFLVIHLILSEYWLLRSVKPHFIKAMDELELEKQSRINVTDSLGHPEN